MSDDDSLDHLIEAPIVIEKHVPPPQGWRDGGQSIFPFAKMEPGDSFTMPLSQIFRIRNAIVRYRYHHKEHHFATRRINDTTCRCWRIK